MRFEAKKSAYQIVTDQIVSLLDKGILPWERPWSTAALPQSVHGHCYRGINQILLSLKPYQDPRWLTFDNVWKRHGHIRKGEKATPVVFWRTIDVGEEDGKMQSIPILRIYHLFNAEQCEKLNLPELEVQKCDGTPIERAEQVIRNLPWPLEINAGNAAYWRPAEPNAITMPPATSFRTMDAYYSTLFHEVSHATSTADRLNRPISFDRSTEVYGLEELVAQFSTAFVCSHLGLDNRLEQDAAYIKSWATNLRNDPKLILKAASFGQKAADYILGIKPEVPIKEVAA